MFYAQCCNFCDDYNLSFIYIGVFGILYHFVITLFCMPSTRLIFVVVCDMYLLFGQAVPANFNPSLSLILLSLMILLPLYSYILKYFCCNRFFYRHFLYLSSQHTGLPFPDIMSINPIDTKKKITSSNGTFVICFYFCTKFAWKSVNR